MRDWNHDGKVDSRDSSIFHNIINSNDDFPKTSGSNGFLIILLWIIGINLILSFISSSNYWARLS